MNKRREKAVTKRLKIQKVAVLAENGFCERDYSEFTSIIKTIGADTRIIASDKDVIKSWDGKDWGGQYAVDTILKKAIPSNYDMLVIPGGSRSINHLKLDQRLNAFLSAFMNTAMPVIVFGNACEILVDTGHAAGLAFAENALLPDNPATDIKCSKKPYSQSKNVLSISRSGKSAEIIEAFLRGDVEKFDNVELFSPIIYVAA